MKIYRKFLGILTDNEENYISLLSASLESIDEFCCLVVVKNPKSFLFRISPSEAVLIPSLVKSIIEVNNLFNIKVDFSKSMKSSASIDFTIKL